MRLSWTVLLTVVLLSKAGLQPNEVTAVVVVVMLTAISSR